MAIILIVVINVLFKTPSLNWNISFLVIIQNTSFIINPKIKLSTKKDILFIYFLYINFLLSTKLPKLSL